MWPRAAHRSGVATARVMKPQVRGFFRGPHSECFLVELSRLVYVVHSDAAVGRGVGKDGGVCFRFVTRAVTGLVATSQINPHRNSSR